MRSGRGDRLGCDGASDSASPGSRCGATVGRERRRDASPETVEVGIAEAAKSAAKADPLLAVLEHTRLG